MVLPVSYFDAHTHHAPANADTVAVQNIIVGHDSHTPDDFSACSVGVHPWYANASSVQAHLDRVRQWAAHPRVWAIGECGLDRLNGPELSVQQAIFQEQINISQAVGKPLIVHSVRAFAEVVALRKPACQPWVLHGFNHRLSVLPLLLDAGFYVSLGAALLRPASPASTAIAHIPADKLLLETDNHEVAIQEIYEAAAIRLSMLSEALREQVVKNARRVYLRRP